MSETSESVTVQWVMVSEQYKRLQMDQEAVSFKSNTFLIQKMN